MHGSQAALIQQLFCHIDQLLDRRLTDHGRSSAVPRRSRHDEVEIVCKKWHYPIPGGCGHCDAVQE